VSVQLSDEEVLSRLRLIDQYGGIRTAARASGMKRSGLQRAVAAARARWGEGTSRLIDRAPQVHAPVPEHIVPPPVTLTERLEISRLKADLSSVKSRLTETEAALVHERHALETVMGLREAAPPPPVMWDIWNREPEGSGIPMFAWSDWHAGETVDPKQVYNYNEFNLAILAKRVERLVERSIYLSTQHTVKSDTSKAVIILGGDFCSGWIHEELVATDECTPLQAVHIVTRLLNTALSRMADVFEQLTVVCVPGNHGRLMKRPPGKLGAYQAMDWLVYSLLKDQFADDDDITFHIPAEGDMILPVLSTRYFIAHGHELGVKGGDGIIGSIGPIMRGRQKAGRMSASLGRDFDIMVLGHFHNMLWLPGNGLIVNNCLIGYSEYARAQKYVATPPSQLLWFTHPKFGAINPIEVFLEDVH